MNFYKFGNQTIQSNVALSVPASPTQIPDITVLVESEPLEFSRTEWIHDYAIHDGIALVRLGNLDSNYLLSFTGYAQFIFNEIDNAIICYPERALKPSTIEHLLLDQVIPRVLSRRNMLVLHGSSISIDGGAIGFLGGTGCGKSTLAAFYGRHGYPVITDDCLIIECNENKVLATPSYPTVRLNPDAAEFLTESTDNIPKVAEYTEKLRINPGQGGYKIQSSSDEIKTLFVLDCEGSLTSQNVVIERCELQKAFMAIVENTFRLDPTDGKSSRNEFEKINILISSVPVYLLNFKRDWNQLLKVVKAINELPDSGF